MPLTKKDLQAIEEVSRKVFLEGVEQVVMPLFDNLSDEIEKLSDEMGRQHEITHRLITNAVERLDRHEVRITVLEQHTGLTKA